MLSLSDNVKGFVGALVGPYRCYQIDDEQVIRIQEEADPRSMISEYTHD